MKKRVSIDDLLAENQLTLVIGEKEYIVKDIPMNLFLKAIESTDSEDPQGRVIEQLALFFDVDESELSDIGMRAATLAINEINNWILQESEAIEKLSEDQKSDVNP